jgi:riboflavin synthase
MFSGIIEEKGVIEKVMTKENFATIAIKTNAVHKGTKVGDSICVDGVCLTVTSKKGAVLSFDLMKETLDATTMKHYKPKRAVNLERSLKVNGRLGGHFVSGHVDCVGILKKVVTLPNYVEFQMAITKPLMRYIVPKGSVTLDGVSLTVGEVKKEQFSVYLIPHTLDVTTFGLKEQGAEMNVETDILAKYVLQDRIS